MAALLGGPGAAAPSPRTTTQQRLGRLPRRLPLFRRSARSLPSREALWVEPKSCQASGGERQTRGQFFRRSSLCQWGGTLVSYCHRAVTAMLDGTQAGSRAVGPHAAAPPPPLLSCPPGALGIICRSLLLGSVNLGAGTVLFPLLCLLPWQPPAPTSVVVHLGGAQKPRTASRCSVLHI